MDEIGQISWIKDKIIRSKSFLNINIFPKNSHRNHNGKGQHALPFYCNLSHLKLSNSKDLIPHLKIRIKVKSRIFKMFYLIRLVPLLSVCPSLSKVKSLGLFVVAGVLETKIYNMKIMFSSIQRGFLS